MWPHARNETCPQVRTSEDAEVIRKQRFGLFIALALAREQYELWERMQVTFVFNVCEAVVSSKAGSFPCLSIMYHTTVY